MPAEMKRSSGSHNVREYLEEIGVLIPRIITLLTRHETGALKGLDVTFSQVRALSVLIERRGCTMGEFARELGITLGAATDLTDRLVRDRLLERLPDPADRRLVRLELSAKGSGTFTTFRRHKLAQWRSIMERLSDEDRLALVKTLRTLHEILERSR